MLDFLLDFRHLKLFPTVPGMTAMETSKQYEILAKHVLGRGFFRLTRYRIRYVKQDGRWTPPHDREIFERGDSACVLLWDPQRDVVVLVEQFRLAARGHAQGPWILELVAGMIESGESPDTVVKREAHEEAGAILDNVIPIGQYYPSPGGCDERVWLFLALVNSDDIDGVFGIPEEEEETRVVKLSFDEAWHEMWSGRANNAPVLIAMQWLAIHKEKYCQRFDSKASRG